MTRDLGTGAFDLNANQSLYATMFVQHGGTDGVESSSQEFLDVLLQDAAGGTVAAFGVGSHEAFFVNQLGESVSSPADTVDAT